MPTYDYICEKCQGKFEAFQSMKDSAFQVCPKELCCLETWGEGTVKRQLGTGAGLIFKGSGFYITDYRSSSYREAAKKESGAKEGGKNEGGKSESGKPESSKTDSSKGTTTPSSSTPPKKSEGQS